MGRGRAGGAARPGWCDPALLDFAGAAMPTPDRAVAAMLGEVSRMALRTTLDELGDRLDARDRDTLGEIVKLIDPWLQLLPGTFGLLHGDYRLDNMLFDTAGGRLVVVDWQTTGIGLPARDLAYFLGSSLPEADRAGYERGLVADYHRALLSYGVPDYSEDTCWRDYRLGMPQIPMLTLLGFAFATATDRGADMTTVMLRRGCRALRELETIELIRELL